MGERHRLGNGVDQPLRALPPSKPPTEMSQPPGAEASKGYVAEDKGARGYAWKDAHQGIRVFNGSEVDRDGEGVQIFCVLEKLLERFTEFDVIVKHKDPDVPTQTGLAMVAQRINEASHLTPAAGKHHSMVEGAESNVAPALTDAQIYSTRSYGTPLEHRAAWFGGEIWKEVDRMLPRCQKTLVCIFCDSMLEDLLQEFCHFEDDVCHCRATRLGGHGGLWKKEEGLECPKKESATT
ncbi:hypothetical protein R3P38DRAFT_2783070 [Favolaschia claudopus]|uniref:Uncharacterized protein n=1 Tax=Favolaschia claudopus TaxID=2862362 RepID=A0AAW0B080_9AGAR